MLDEYLWGHIQRISPEAPVPILSVARRSSTLGGAGNVVDNLRGLGAQVSVFGVTGADDTGQQIRDLLSAHGADSAGVITDSSRQSTRKVRLMSLEHGQQVFRLDHESCEFVRDATEEQLIAGIQAMPRGIQAIVCSDYLKGVLSDRVLSVAFDSSRDRKIHTIVAPKDVKPDKYRGADVLMPNALELNRLTGNNDGSELPLDESARYLLEKLSLLGLVVTRGSEGMSLFEKSGGTVRRTDISTSARSVFDVTGAGDTAVAAFAAAVASGASLQEAARLANIAAGVKVGKRGTASITIEEIRAAANL